MVTTKDKLNNQNKKGEKTMKKINWKAVSEKAKSIALIIIFTGAIAFYTGMKYQEGLDAHTNNKVSEAVKAVSVKSQSKP